MTSRPKEQTLCSLLFQTTPHYETNLQTLLTLLKQIKQNSIVLAHEVALTGFAYDDIEKAAAFSARAIDVLKEASMEKTIVLTMLESINGKIYNVAKIFHRGEVIYERSKARLFKLGNEDKYMSEGSDEAFEIIEVDGIKIAILICFELRFKELWKMAEGADVILTPSWWGKPRGEHFKLLTKTLAVMNECYVIASDALNEECSGFSSIISPQGEAFYNGNKPCLEVRYNKKNITLMRRYINTGIK